MGGMGTLSYQCGALKHVHICEWKVFLLVFAPANYITDGGCFGLIITPICNPGGELPQGRISTPEAYADEMTPTHQLEPRALTLPPI